MEVTLGEQVLLLSLDDETGRVREETRTACAVAGAAVLELVLAGRVEVADDRVCVRDPGPLGNPALDEVLARIAEGNEGRRRPRRTKDCVQHLRGAAVSGANRALVERGLVREEKSKVLGLFPVTRYPETDGSVEKALRQRLEAVVLGGEQPDERTASLVALVHGAKLHRQAFPGADQRAARSRTKEIAEGQWAGEAVRGAIEAVQAATAAVVAATAAAGAAG